MRGRCPRRPTPQLSSSSRARDGGFAQGRGCHHQRLQLRGTCRGFWSRGRTRGRRPSKHARQDDPQAGSHPLIVRSRFPRSTSERRYLEGGLLSRPPPEGLPVELGQPPFPPPFEPPLELLPLPPPLPLPLPPLPFPPPPPLFACDIVSLACRGNTLASLRPEFKSWGRGA